MRTRSNLLYQFTVVGCLAFSLGVAASPAAAATLFDARVRLVKTPDSPRLYAVVAGRRHLVRTPSILDSYAYRSKGVETVSEESLATLSPTRLVKSALGPRVYLIDERTGQKLWYPTPESFLAAGERWQDIVEVSGVDARAYRNAHLVRLADSPVVYYLDFDRLTRAPISSAADFTQSGFTWGDVVTVSRPLLEAYALAAPFVPGSVPPPTAPPAAGAVLTVRAGLKPGPSTVPAGSSRNLIWELEFVAAGGPVTVTALTLTRRGLAADADLTSVSLVDEQGQALTRPQRLVNAQATFTLTSPFVVSAEQPRRVSALATVAFTPATSGAAFSLELDRAGVLASSPVQGNFPLGSPSHVVLGVSGVLGTLAVDVSEVNQTARSVVAGTKDVVLTRLELRAGASEDVLLEQLVWHGVGSARLSELTAYEVLDERAKVVAATVTAEDTRLIVRFKTSHRVPRGEVKTLTVRADVAGAGGASLQLVLFDDFDLVARGERTGFTLTPVAGPREGNFPVGDGPSGTANQLRIEPGQVLLALSPSSPSGAVTRGADDVILAAFDVRASGQAMRWERVDLVVGGVGPRTPLVGTVRLRERKRPLAGEVDARAALDQPVTLTFGSPVLIPANKTVTVEVVGTIAEAATASDAYAVELRNAVFQPQPSGSRVTFAATVAAGVRPVQEVTLLVRTDPKFSGGEAVAGQAKVKLGRLLFQASPAERVRVEQVTLVAVASQPDFGSGFANLKLGRGAIPAPTGATLTFNVGSEVAAGKEIGLDVVVDTTSAVDGRTLQFRVSDVSAFAVTSRARAGVTFSDVVTPTTTFRRTSLLVTSNPVFSGGAAARSTATLVGSFTLSISGVEAVGVSDLTLAEASGSSGLSVARGYKNLRLVNAATGRAVSATVKSPTGGVGGDRLTKGPTIGAGQTLTVNVLVDATAAPVGDTVQLVLAGVTAKGRTVKVAPLTTGLPLTMAAVTL